MPTISVFIRVDDLPKWKALEKKSQWLHDRLIEKPFRAQTLNEQVSTVKKIINAPDKLCKHGADPKFCKFSKPGKLCK